MYAKFGSWNAWNGFGMLFTLLLTSKKNIVHSSIFFLEVKIVTMYNITFPKIYLVLKKRISCFWKCQIWSYTKEKMKPLLHYVFYTVLIWTAYSTTLDRGPGHFHISTSHVIDWKNCYTDLSSSAYRFQTELLVVNNNDPIENEHNPTGKTSINHLQKSGCFWTMDCQSPFCLWLWCTQVFINLKLH